MTFSYYSVICVNNYAEVVSVGFGKFAVRASSEHCDAGIVLWSDGLVCERRTTAK